jgi:hypothetical protein
MLFTESVSPAQQWQKHSEALTHAGDAPSVFERELFG